MTAPRPPGLCLCAALLRAGEARITLALSRCAAGPSEESGPGPFAPQAPSAVWAHHRKQVSISERKTGRGEGIAAKGCSGTVDRKPPMSLNTESGFANGNSVMKKE